VLGNTFHLFLRPGGELIEQLGGLHRFMGWERRSSPTRVAFRCSRWGTARLPTRSRAAVASRRRRAGSILAIEEDGVRFRSYVDGGERFISPEISMAVQAQLHSDIVLAFDECTPFHVDRDYTARSTERTHRWLERCTRWRAEHREQPRRLALLRDRPGRRVRGPASRLGRGCRRERRRRDRDRRLARTADKAQMYEVIDWSTRELERSRRSARVICWESARSTT
jgi:queuine tRNA-ribosyltransferase